MSRKNVLNIVRVCVCAWCVCERREYILNVNRTLIQHHSAFFLHRGTILDGVLAGGDLLESKKFVSFCPILQISLSITLQIPRLCEKISTDFLIPDQPAEKVRSFHRAWMDVHRETMLTFAS